jgi:hypothetical protein
VVEWEERQRYYQRSRCGRFSVAAYRSPVRPSFILWRLDGEKRIILGRYDRAEKARAAAEDHAK